MSEEYKDFLRDDLAKDREIFSLLMIEEIIHTRATDFSDAISEILSVIPYGFRTPRDYNVRIMLDNNIYHGMEFQKGAESKQADIKLLGKVFGRIEVFYVGENNKAEFSSFTDNENKLIKEIAYRLANFYLLHKYAYKYGYTKSLTSGKEAKPEWKVLLEVLRKTDKHLYSILSRKMINYLFVKGVKEARELFENLGPNLEVEQSTMTEVNRPSKKHVLEQAYKFGFEIFEIASKYMDGEDLTNQIQKWTNDEKSSFLIKVLADRNAPLSVIAESIRRFYHIYPVGAEQTTPVTKGIRVSLIRRLLTDQLQFINIAKDFMHVSDFYELLNNLIFNAESHGNVGGKSAGLFLAKKIIEKTPEFSNELKGIKSPKTWYIISDAVVNFIYYNNLEDVMEQKYKTVDEIRQEYPYIIQAFKNSRHTPEIINGLSRALDDFGDSPIIVRSSSLLEDRIGAVFAGKYKSLFLANQGSKKEKLESLCDAISEVYASTLGPDPIGYRIERGLLDFSEEMGIMIQEVVGKRFGKYFFPAFAGVAFSNNEMRWSPRIKRQDGLLRLVPGLGTRSVDRVSNDYPVLIAPGQPGLRVNQSYNDLINYSPSYIDVINLEENTFETIEINQLIKSIGNRFPMLNKIFSIDDGSTIREPVGIGIDTKKHKVVATFENLIKSTTYVKQLNIILKILRDRFGAPVDVEFACDGDSLYLLQCRPQSATEEDVNMEIPTDIPDEYILFTANKHVSQGKVPDIHYIVYVDPLAYAGCDNYKDLQRIGKAVGLLNKNLPKKSFILMGPGRWGSRDDIKLGVRVGYSDINKTAMLVEIAEKKGSYLPDLSFGTHFFQDLIEAQIRYLPLYPGDNGNIFNYEFFRNSENILSRFLPEYEDLSGILKVINVKEATDGLVMRVFLNSKEDRAMGALTEYSKTSTYRSSSTSAVKSMPYNEAVEWRTRLAEGIAGSLSKQKYGVKEIYLFGTTYNGTAGPDSDIDIFVHFCGNKRQRKELTVWFEGWNASLKVINYFKTGYKVERLLDVKILDDNELEEQSYFKEMTQPGANSAQRLQLLGEKVDNGF